MLLSFFRKNFSFFRKSLRHFLLFSALLAGLLLPGTPLFAAAAGGKNGAQNYQPLPLLAKRYGITVKRNGDAVELYHPQRKLLFFPTKRYFFFNGVKGSLNFPVVIQQGRPCISALDQRTVLDPLLGDPARFHRRVYTVVIDPGHGGHDQGAAGNGIVEKDLTLKVAKRVAALLQQRRFRVVMTRRSDANVPLSARPRIAARYQADLFLSIHVNAAKDRSLAGIECFSVTPRGGVSSNDGRIIRDAAAGDRAQRESCLLSWYLQNSLLRMLKAEDRGIKMARFVVIRECSCPSALIEIGYLSNPQEARRLSSAAYQEKCARAIVDGLCRYLLATRGSAK